MAGIGGNIIGTLQVQETKKNRIGEPERIWSDAVQIEGWLGLQSGDSKYSSYNAKIEESTHVFLCDYNSRTYALSNQDIRMLIKGRIYDVMLIDNPDEMNEQLEVYLKMVGGNNAGG